MKSETIVDVDNIVFITRTNGDRIEIRKVHFTAQNAANLAQMINSNKQLKIIIKDSIEN